MDVYGLGQLSDCILSIYNKCGNGHLEKDRSRPVPTGGVGMKKGGGRKET